MTADTEVTSEAASLLGKRSWQARLKKYGLKKLRKMLSESGKKATGRPRRPDESVKPNALYQRARRERLRAPQDVNSLAVLLGRKRHGRRAKTKSREGR